jgi:hypothetical protein
VNAQSNKDKQDNAPCRKHDGKHKWKDYPDNWSNKDKNSSTQGNSTPRNPKSRSNRGEVTTMESRNNSSNSRSGGVRFEEVDYETDDDTDSCGEVMAINATPRTNYQTNLHPIMIITLPDKNKKRVACKVLH